MRPNPVTTSSVDHDAPTAWVTGNRGDECVAQQLLQPFRSAPTAILETVTGHSVPRFEVNRHGLTFGRSEKRDVVLQGRLASRFHAEIRYLGDCFVLRDLGSVNGVQVNGARVDHGLCTDTEPAGCRVDVLLAIERVDLDAVGPE